MTEEVQLRIMTELTYFCGDVTSGFGRAGDMAGNVVSCCFGLVGLSVDGGVWIMIFKVRVGDWADRAVYGVTTDRPRYCPALAGCVDILAFVTIYGNFVD